MNVLDVHVEVGGSVITAGTARFGRRSRSLTTTFQYRPEYLGHPLAYPLDPALPLFSGQHATPGLPGAFSDAAPDRWGRNLIRKRLLAQGARPGARSLDDVDFLVNVSDFSRQGAVRFSEPDGPMLDVENVIPTLVELPALLRASDTIESGADDDLNVVKALLGAGTGTLGGARPKASVRDGDQLLIAKFPKPNDDRDVMAWEATVLALAEQVGIAVPKHRIVKIDGRSVLLLRRFDRDGDRRIGYWSAMTMLGATDGDSGDYVDVAEILADHGAQTAADLAQLWRRVAFSVLVNNTDDHLRNHGFLRGRSGWTLSPAFDLNPEHDIGPRATSIGGVGAGADQLDALFEYRATFGLAEQQCRTVLGEVVDAVAGWRDVAAGHGIPRSELTRMTPAFEQYRARALHLARI